MNRLFRLFTVAALLSQLALTGHADETKPVRMGSGIMTFDTVPGWGLGEDGKSVLGPTHGGVVIDKEGSIYVSANKGLVVFSPEGKVLRSYVDDQHSNMHDMEIREEDGTEYIYAARNQDRE